MNDQAAEAIKSDFLEWSGGLHTEHGSYFPANSPSCAAILLLVTNLQPAA